MVKFPQVKNCLNTELKVKEPELIETVCLNCYIPNANGKVLNIIISKYICLWEQERKKQAKLKELTAL
jgi:hypothetical protein